MDRLRQHFTGVASKYLSRVDATPTSNQHEIGSKAFASILGDPGHSTVIFDASFFFFTDDDDETLKAAGQVSWYDVRRNNPNRKPELRLYYQENAVTTRMTEGDFCIVAARPDRSVMIIVSPPGSTMEQQLRWLFNIDRVTGSRFKVQDVNAERQVKLIEALVLNELGIEVRQDDDIWLDRILEQFGPSFPKTADFSHFARLSCPNDLDAVQDPDQALIEWITHEEMLFRTLERNIVQQQLDEGFRDVDHFISMSLSVQNRRKSRVGFALEHHLAAVFEANQLTFGRQVVTENKATADFLFPSQAAYHNTEYPDQKLLMLASKSTCKDRWRQVLAEAKRIPEKHLFTLEPAISRHQTDEMQTHNVRLVIPSQLRPSFAPEQQPWLMCLSSFIQLARDKTQS